MKKILMNIAISLVSIETISVFFANLIAKLLRLASEKGGDSWDKMKSIIRKLYDWLGMLIEVYDDDTLTKEEEEKIAEAISKETAVHKIVDIIKKSN